MKLTKPATVGAMASPQRVPNRPDDPALHVRAMDNLSFIRETMGRATAFTAVPGWGGVGMGVLGLAAAAVAETRISRTEWLVTWLATSALGLTLGGWTMASKARRAGTTVFSYSGRRFVLSYVPPLVVGALLTLVLVRAELWSALPGTWLLLYGTAVTTAGAFSIRVVPIMGICLMAVGASALIVAPTAGDLFMALGFGVLQIGFGLLIARRYGG